MSDRGFPKPSLGSDAWCMALLGQTPSATPSRRRASASGANGFARKAMRALARGRGVPWRRQDQPGARAATSPRPMARVPAARRLLRRQEQPRRRDERGRVAHGPGLREQVAREADRGGVPSLGGQWRGQWTSGLARSPVPARVYDLRHAASQAECRGFEPHHPLHRKSTARPTAGSERAGRPPARNFVSSACTGSQPGSRVGASREFSEPPRLAITS